MAWLVGMDEAGYGPNLGPLAIAATAWQLQDSVNTQTDLYDLLKPAVSRAPDKTRLAIADSKLLYKPGGSLALLEQAVLASAGSDNFAGLLEALDADAHHARESLPWHAGFNPALPRHACREQIAENNQQLAAACRAAGISAPIIRARLVFPAEFNQLVDRYDSKGAALSHATIGLFRRVVDGLKGEVFATLDKHGGRNRYGALLQHHFPEHRITALEESRPQSRYRLGPEQSPIHLAFRAKGESFLPAALASMTAKYLRELSMLALNQFWADHVDNLKPTAGYPVDAKRFKSEISKARQRLKITDNILWRNR